MMRSRKAQVGLSIVELMIALVLGLLLTLGLAQIFTGSQQSFRLAEGLSRTQESGRVASEILGRAIRNADYWGCAKGGGIQTNLDTTNAGFVAGVHDFVGQPNVLVTVATASDTAVAGTHVITLRGADGNGMRLVDDASNTAAVFRVNDVSAVEEGDILLVSDCSAGVVFQVTEIINSTVAQLQHNTGDGKVPGNDTKGCPTGAPAAASCFPKKFTSGGVYVPYIRRYEVREDGGRRALYLVDGASPAVELVEDVVDLRVQVVESDAPTTWVEVSAGASIDFDEVVAMRVNLLVRSATDNVVTSAQTLCFPTWSAGCTAASPNWTAPDRRKYEVYSMTAAIRNRLIEAL